MLFRQTTGKGFGRRSADLTSPQRRRSIARTLREIADPQARNAALGGRYRPRHTASVSRRESLEALAAALENENRPVTPAGVRSVLDLVTSGTGPLWGTDEQALDDALERTFAILEAHPNVRMPESRAA